MRDSLECQDIRRHDGTAGDIGWLRGKYGVSPQLARAGWTLVRVWEQSQAMTAGVQLLDTAGAPIVGHAVEIGWPGQVIPAFTRSEGWVDVPLSGANYDPATGAGPMFIRAADGSFVYTGIGWPDLSNHDHLNLVLMQGTAPTPGPEPDIPIALIRADLLLARDAIDRALGRLP